MSGAPRNNSTPDSEPSMDEILKSVRRIISEEPPRETNEPTTNPFAAADSTSTRSTDRSFASLFGWKTAPALQTNLKPPRAKPKLFLSYRRNDTQHLAGRMFDRLVTQFGESDLFFDVDTIPYGVNFREHIRTFISDCDIMIVVIGPNWTSATWSQPELDIQDDFVLVELHEALAANVRLLPVLADDTRMPRSTQLPQWLRGLSHINAPHVRAGRDFHVDIAKILHVIDSFRTEEHRPS